MDKFYFGIGLFGKLFKACSDIDMPTIKITQAVFINYNVLEFHVPTKKLHDFEVKQQLK